MAVVAAIVLLGALYAPFNPGAACLFIYGAGFAGQIGRPAVGVRCVALIVLLLALEAWLVGIPGYTWVWGIVFSLIVGGINIHFSEVARGQAKLRLAHEEVERLATSAERERIARDLHDLLGRTLSLITIKAGLAARLAGRDGASAEREMREVEAISRNALCEVRRAVQGYRFSSLGAELAKAKVALAAAGVELEATTGPFDLTVEAESAAALALREAVTNVVRHAGAQVCRISYRQGAGEFRLEVEDDGRGGGAPEGSGLAGMRERIEGLGGSVARNGRAGTSLCIVLPLDRTAPGDRRTATA
jgi:two-component system sensor histidine kinase DesK